MLANTVKKVTWMARATTTVVGLAIMLALVFGVATTALAGTGIGARFDLGKTNTVNAVSKLVGSVAGPSLQIDNNSAGAGATALDLQVEAGKAPMTVNSDVQVANLNADKLDGTDSTGFVPKSFYVKNIPTTGQAGSVDGTRLGEASCDPGDRVLTGGFFGLDEGTRLISSFPTTTLPEWNVVWENDATADTINIVVHCINQTP